MRIFIEDTFSASHYLRDYKGKCESPHGHNFKVRVEVEGEVKENGMVMDFEDLKKILKEILSLLDHKDLNSIPPFLEKNPTCEHIAEFLMEKLEEKLPSGIKPVLVMVEEKPGQGAIYERR